MATQVDTVERLRRQQAEAWQRGAPLPFEQLLKAVDVGELGEEGVLKLIVHEFALRRQSGEQLELAKFLERFPMYRDRLQELFERLSNSAMREFAGAPGTERPAAGLRPPTRPDPTSEVTALSAANPDPTFLSNSAVSAVDDSLHDESGRKIGPYQLLSKLGQGGMGAVYKARHTRLDKTVAVKLLPRHRTADPVLLARFEREMRAVGNLDHPQIIRAHDADEEGGTHYLVMEYLEGNDLSQRVKGEGPLPIGLACEIVRQAALGLQYAHDHGFVHRDIKPSNLFLTKSGHVKILDLGLARLQDDTGRDEAGAPAAKDLTQENQFLGTPDYMAPEQWDTAQPVDYRADLYALGCTFFMLLTGRAPFGTPENKSFAKKAIAHALGEVPEVRSLRPEIPVALAKLVKRLMAKAPADRLQPAAEVARLLHPYAVPIVAASVYDVVPPPTATAAEIVVARHEELGAGEAPAGEFGNGRPPRLGAAVAPGDTAPPRTPSISHSVRPPSSHSAARERSRSGAAASSGVSESSRAGDESDAPGELQVLPTETARRRPALWLAWSAIVALLGIAAAGYFARETDAGRALVARITQAFGPRGGRTTEGDGEAIARHDAGANSTSGADSLGTPRETADSASDTTGRPAPSGVEEATDPVPLHEGWAFAPRAEPAPESLEVTVTIPEAGLPLHSFSAVREPGSREGLRSWSVESAGHPTPISAVAWNPAGVLIATAGHDGTVRLWDNGRLRRILPGHTAVVTRLAWSPSGKHLASSSLDQRIRIWDVLSGTLVQIVELAKPGRSVDWSHDGQFLAIAHGGGWSIYDTKSRELKQPGRGIERRAIAWSPDGARLATVNATGSLSVWDVANLRKEADIDSPHADGGFVSVAWSADGKWIAGGFGPEASHVGLWSAESNELKRDWNAPGPLGTVVRFDASSQKLLSAGSWGVRVWDVETGQAWTPAAETPIPGAADADWSPDGMEIVAATVRVGDPSPRPAVILSSHTAVVRESFGARDVGLAKPFAPHVTSDGTTSSVFVVEAEQVVRWNLSTHTRDGSWPMRPVTFAVSRDGKQMAQVSEATSSDVVLLSTDTGAEQARWKGNSALPTALAYSPDGTHLAAADGVFVRLWNVSTQSPHAALDAHAEPVTGLAWSPNGEFLATTARDQTVRIWSAGDGKPQRTIEAVAAASAAGLGWSHDSSQLAVWTTAGSVVVIDRETGRVTEPVFKGSGTVGGIAWSPTDRRLAVGDEAAHSLTLLTLRADGTVDDAVNRATSVGLLGASAVAWLPDGTELVAGHSASGAITHLATQPERLERRRAMWHSRRGWVAIDPQGGLNANPEGRQSVRIVVLTDDGRYDSYTVGGFERRFKPVADATESDTSKCHGAGF